MGHGDLKIPSTDFGLDARLGGETRWPIGHESERVFESFSRVIQLAINDDLIDFTQDEGNVGELLGALKGIEIRGVIRYEQTERAVDFLCAGIVSRDHDSPGLLLVVFYDGGDASFERGQLN